MTPLESYLIYCWNYLTHLQAPQIFMACLPCLLLDFPRFVLSKFLLFFWEVLRDLLSGLWPLHTPPTFEVWPRLTVIVPGLNEERGMLQTIRSLMENRYPDLEIIVVDDGSTDRTFDLCRPLALSGAIRLFRKSIPGGKSSAANLGLQMASGEVVVIVDSDTSFHSDALFRIVAPFADPRVGAVSGNVRVGNWRQNLLTRFQGVEYLHCIFMGRRLHSALHTLNIASGAFGAFRRSALLQIGGWDVGPGEDGDLTTKIRKAGYQILFAPEAVCLTKAPETLRAFVKQRLRWNRGVVRYRLRKHLNLANPFSHGFRLSNFFVVLDALLFRVFLPIAAVGYLFYMLFFHTGMLPLVALLAWSLYAVLNLLQVPLILHYSTNTREDAILLLTTFVLSPYHILDRTIRTIAIFQEFFLRSSYRDPYVPARVGAATIHW